MTEHASTTRVREVIDAFMRGDLDAVLARMTDDAVYRVPGHNLVSGNYRGKQEIRDFFMRLFEVTGGTMRLGVDDVMGDDHHAVMFWTLTAERNGKSLDAHGAMAFKLDDEGKFTESWFLYSDQAAYDDFYS